MTYTFRPWHVFLLLGILGVLYLIYMAFTGHYFCYFRDLACGREHEIIQAFQVFLTVISLFFSSVFILSTEWSYTIKVPTLGFKTKSKKLDPNDEAILDLTSSMIKAHNEGRHGDEEAFFNRIQERELLKLKS